MFEKRDHPKKFNLSHYFSSTYVLIFVIAALLVGGLYQQTSYPIFRIIVVILAGLSLVFVLMLRRERQMRDQQSLDFLKLSQAVEQSPGSVIITDLHGNIEYVNPKFVKTSGYTKEDVLGQNPRLLKSGEQSEKVYRELWEAITSGREWYGEFYNKRKDGSYYWEHATIGPIYDAKGKMTHFLAIKEDITERKRAEDALRESEKRFRKVIEYDVDAILVVDQNNIVRFINPAAKELFDFQGDTLVGKHFSIPVLEGETTELEIPRRDGSTSIVEIRTVEIEWENEPAYLESLRDITNHKQAEEALRESQQQLEHSYQREHSRLQLSDTLRETARIVSSTLDQQKVLDLIFDQLEKVIIYHRATVSLLEGETLTMMAGRDKMGNIIKRFTYPAYQYPLNSEILTSKQPVVVPDVTRDERWQPSQTMQGIRSIIFAPLVVQQQSIGMLVVSRTDEIPYTEDDTRTVFAFANQVAISMHNAHLYARMQERNRRLTLLHDISQAVSSTLDLHTLLTAACQKLVANFHSDHSAVVLFNESYTHGEVVAEYPTGHAQGIRIALGGYAAAKELITTAKPIAVYDAQHDPLTEKIRSVIRSLRVQSILIVPLITKDRVIGSFSLDITTSRRHFEPSEIEMAQTIASQLSVAIENARWLERERERLDEELTTAWRIQTSLLPVSVPDIPSLDVAGFSYPARRVGGDFYNYFTFDREHLGVAVGDVSGKGMQAALMMALSVGLLTTKVRKEMSPSELLATLNFELHPHMQRNWMNTALSYVTLCPSQNTPHAWDLAVANAGLVAPLIRRKNGIPEWLDVRGLPLGMIEEIQYDKIHDMLVPGDMIFLSSDGVVEASNGNGEMYGPERLAACVASASNHSAQNMLKCILDDVHTFVGDAEAADDMTMVVIIVQDGPSQFKIERNP